MSMTGILENKWTKNYHGRQLVESNKIAFMLGKKRTVLNGVVTFLLA